MNKGSRREVNKKNFNLLILLAILFFEFYSVEGVTFSDSLTKSDTHEQFSQDFHIRKLNEQQQTSVGSASELSQQSKSNFSDISSKSTQQPKMNLTVLRQKPLSKIKSIDMDSLLGAVMFAQDINGRVIYKNNNEHKINDGSVLQDINKNIKNSFEFINKNQSDLKNVWAVGMISKEKEHFDMKYEVLRYSKELRNSSLGLIKDNGQVRKEKEEEGQKKGGEFRDIQNDGYPQADSNKPGSPKNNTNVEIIPFCIIVPSYNNAKNRVFIRNVNSIMQQEYPAYHVVYIDDKSEDNTTEAVLSYLGELFEQKGNESFEQGVSKGMDILDPIENANQQTDQVTTRSFNKIKWTFAKNTQRKYALENLYQGIHNYCQNNQIAVILDGDDALIGTQVLSYLNRVYKLTKYLFIYSSYTYKKQIPLNHSYTMPTDWPVIYQILKTNDDTIKTYEPQWVKYELEKWSKNHTTYAVDHVISYERGPAGVEIPVNAAKEKRLREIQTLIASHVLTFSVALFKKIDKSNFLDENQQFFRYAYDRALTLTLTETAYPRVHFLKDILYEYSANTGINDSPENWGNDSLKIRSKKPLEPLKTQQVDQILQAVFKKQ